MDTYSPLFINTGNGWQIVCCANGTSGSVCNPLSGEDYSVSCENLFGLSTGDNCDCGNLCTGQVVWNGTASVCEGDCVCNGVCCDDGASCTNAPTLTPTGTSMYCQPGWQTLYVENDDGSWYVVCCANGISDGACFPSSVQDYNASCDSIYGLVPGSTCNCGTLCNGTLVWNGTGDATCNGSCSCSGQCCVDGATCTDPFTGTEGGMPMAMGLIFGGIGIVLGGLVLYGVYLQAFSSSSTRGGGRFTLNSKNRAYRNI